MVSFVRAEDCDGEIFVEIQNKSFKEDYLRYGECYTCHLDCLCIIPQYENQGIGQKAVEFIESQFPNATSWYLETPSDKKRNHYFYIKCGYEITDEKMEGNVKVVIFSKTINK